VAQSHSLADNYSRTLGASYRGEEGDQGDFFSQMAAGVRGSLLGGVALAHGDAAGLALPPALAPRHVVITPIPTRRGDADALAAEAERLRRVLARAGLRAAVDARRLKPAARFAACEASGAPLRLELGPRDVAAGECVLARRTVPGRAGKLRGVSTEAQPLVRAVLELLEDAQTAGRAGAAAALQEGIVDVASFMELRVRDGLKGSRSAPQASRHVAAGLMMHAGVCVIGVSDCFRW
jgi:prolyl-tRNA synthetase